MNFPRYAMPCTTFVRASNFFSNNSKKLALVNQCMSAHSNFERIPYSQNVHGPMHFLSVYVMPCLFVFSHLKRTIAMECLCRFKRLKLFRLGSFEIESSAVLKEGLEKSKLSFSLSKFRFNLSLREVIELYT